IVSLVVTLDPSRLATTLNRLERSIQIGIHKWYQSLKRNSEFQSLLSQLKIHGAGVSTEDANHKFLKSLPSFWSQASLIMRTKPGVETLSFNDLYNNLRVFEPDVKGSIASSSSIQNVAFVSSDNTSSTNEVSTAYGVSTSFGHNSQREGSSSYTDELVAMIFMRLKKFYKKTWRKLQFDAKEPVGFDKTKVECFNCHNTEHFARECRSKGNQESGRRDTGNTGYKARDNGRRPTKHDEPKAMVTIDGDGVDWTSHAEDDIENYALMVFNFSNSGSDTEVTFCSKECEESYAKLKKIYDEQREQLGDASIEIQAYTLALKSFTHLIRDCDFHEKRMAKQVELNKSKDKGNGQRNDKPMWNNVQRLNHQNKFVPTAILTKTGKFPINAARQKNSSQAASTSIVRKVNTARPIVNEIKPRNNVYKSHSPIRKPFNRTTTPKANFANHKVNTAGDKTDDPQQTLNRKGIVDSGRFRHMTRNKAYLVEYQEFNDGRVAFGGSKGIKREYSNARTLQQNRVAERKNRTLIEAARTMLADLFLPNTFWAEAVSTACYVLNRALVTTPQNKTPYELITGKIPIIIYIRHFGCHVTILNTIDHLGKFEEKSDKGFLVGYSLNSKAFRPVTTKNKANKIAGPKEANNSAGTQDNIDAGNSKMKAKPTQEYVILPLWSSYTSTVKSSEAKNVGEKPNRDIGSKTNKDPVDQEDQTFLEELERLKRQENEADDAAKTLRKKFAQSTKDLLLQAGAARASSTNYVNTVSTPVNTASPLRNVSIAGPSYPDLSNYANQDDSQIPGLKDIYEVPSDGIFTSASYDNKGAVDDFTNLKSTMNVSPIPQSMIHSIHPTTQILEDPNSAVQTRSKVKKSLVAHAFVEPKKISQALEDESWVDAMQEELLQFKTQKSAFLYGKINEEVYVSQPPGFIDPKFPKKVYKVVKALYGLHQAPRAWYATLSTFLVKQKEDGIFISQDKYVAKILKKFDFMSVKTVSTPIETHKPLVNDEEAADVDVTLKTSHLYAVKRIFRRLISWQCKKPKIMATSTTEAEYVAAANCLKNPVFHSKTKHIEIRHHFIRDAYEKKLIHVLKIHTDDNVVDLLTKAFNVSRQKVSTARPKLSTARPKLSTARQKLVPLVSQTVNNVSQIKATVSGQTVLISESSIRRDLLFNNDNGIDCLTVADIYENLPLIGSKSTSWDQFPTNVTSAVICLAIDRTFNFSKMIFNGHVTPLFPTMLVPAAVEEGEENTRNTRNTLEGIGGSEGDQVGKKELVSKQGRKNDKPGPTLDDSAFDDLDADLVHGMDYMETKEAVNEGMTSSKTEQLNVTNDTMIIEEKGSGEKGGSTKDPVSTAVPKFSTAVPEEVDIAMPEVSTASILADSTAHPTPTTVFEDEDIFLVDALVMLSDKTKLKGVEINEIKDTDRPAKSILTLKPLPTIDPKDKCKGILEKEPEPVNVKSKGQDEAKVAMDEEVARKLDEHIQSELERKRVVEEEATNASLIRVYDEIQARINADSIVAARLQEEEREKFAAKESAKFLHDTVVAQRKFIAEQRASAIRNKPHTKSQLRSQMMTYLRHVGGYKHAQLNRKNFKEIHVLYVRQKKYVQDFVLIDYAKDKRRIEEMSKKVAGEDTSTKRKGGTRMKRMSKRKKTDSDLEEEQHLKTFLKIVPNEEGIIDYEVLEKIFLIINWESKFYHYDIHRAKASNTGSLDLMERFETTTPEGVDLVLWGDLRIMFEANVEDESGRVKKDGIYPLTKETLERMMPLKLIAESASDGAYNLLSIIQKHIDESESYDGSEKDL
nr:ribonuclease H-like domain-containing protein [Tanacetum cinerariifolium]